MAGHQILNLATGDRYPYALRNTWPYSSDGLERFPVTEEVAGSNPVRVAKPRWWNGIHGGFKSRFRKD
jgi:hypothetical protein